MKKIFYIGAFMFLGLLLSQLLHAVLEMPALAYITGQYAAGEVGFLGEHWGLIHSVGGKFLSFSGLLLGFFLGRKFWQILYVEKRYGTPRW